MSTEKITIDAVNRDVFGKKVRSLRESGKTPAVIHDHGKKSLHITLEEQDFKKVFSSAGRHHPVVVKLEGKSYTTMIKEVTNKPASAKVYHSVFQAIKANETVKAEVPLQLTGEIPAEKNSLLVLKNLDYVEVEALPADLIDSLEVDASGLTDAGDKLHVSDIKAPGNVEIKTDPDMVVATVEIPKDQIAEADAAAADLAEDAAGEGAETVEGSDTSGDVGGADSGEGEDADDAQSNDEKQG